MLAIVAFVFVLAVVDLLLFYSGLIFGLNMELDSVQF